MSSSTEREKTPLKNSLSEESKGAGDLDSKKADEVATKEFKAKYGFAKAPSSMAQRKISATGGKQYFDSGKYYGSKSSEERQEIASHPHAMDPQAIKAPAVNPVLAQMRRGANIGRTPKSKLATGKSPLAA